MRRLFFVLLLLARPGAADTVQLKPSPVQALLGVRAPLVRIHPGDRVVGETPPGGLGDVGPIEVLGAEPGDALRIRVERLEPKGTVASSLGGPGEPRGMWHLDPTKQTAQLEGSSVALPLRPVLGSLGVAPRGDRTVPALEMGPSGGDLALGGLAQGASVVLPVFHSGAFVYFGDGRVAPWSGSEGSGVFLTLEVTLAFELVKRSDVDWPRIEDSTSIAVLASGPTLSDSARLASQAMERWLVEDRSLSEASARALRAEGVSQISAPGATGASLTLVRLPKELVPGAGAKGVRVGDLSWAEAEKVLTPDRVVVLPLGAAAKEHGLHLLLKNDEILAEYFARRTLQARPVALLPTLTYGFYPAFLDYPGSTSFSLEVQRDAVVQICRSIARHGPRRFYVLNTGISTLKPLKASAELLAHEGILMRFTDLNVVGHAAETAVRKETYGTHADEIETSMLLYIQGSAVRMERAVADGAEERPGPLTRDRSQKVGHYSPSGVFGDPTLATWEKGRAVVEGALADIAAEIDALAGTSPPQGEPRSPLDPIP